MIRFLRSRKYRRHIHNPALDYAKKAAAFINKRYPEVNFQVFRGLFGSVETIYWISDFEGLAALEQWLAKLDTDQEWQDFVKKVPPDIFIEGTADDTVLKLE